MNTPLTNEVSLALAWWQHGCLTGDALVAWVDRRILAMDGDRAGNFDTSLHLSKKATRHCHVAGLR